MSDQPVNNQQELVKRPTLPENLHDLEISTRLNLLCMFADDMDAWLKAEVLPVIVYMATSTPDSRDDGRPGHPAAWCEKCNLNLLIDQLQVGNV